MIFTLASILGVIGCDTKSGGMQSSPGDVTATRSASTSNSSVTVGEDSWTFVPSTQCSIYPGNVVSIAGHAAEDPSLEIVIDYGGPTGVTIGTYGREPWWQAVANTMKVEIEGRRMIQGTATFEVYRNGTKETHEGSFEITCS
jgi:hypothetical protein